MAQRVETLIRPPTPPAEPSPTTQMARRRRFEVGEEPRPSYQSPAPRPTGWERDDQRSGG